MDINVTHTHYTLFKRGVRGEVRVWFMQEGETSDGRGAHRVVSGIEGGAMTESGWTITEPKNVGKKNATTSKEQAVAEVQNLYAIKKERGYFASPLQIDEVPFTKPMLAHDIEKRRGKFRVEDGVFAQPKLDGIRCIARSDGLWTRTGKPITAVPHIVQMLAPLFDADPDLILDGELYNHQLKDDFNTITSIVRKEKPTAEEIEQARGLIQYHVYDTPSHSGVFSERYTHLLRILEGEGGPHFDENWHGIHVVETRYLLTEEELDDAYAQWLEAGYEGQMVRLDAPYENKRSNNLMKRKDFLSDEFKVLAVHEGNGNWRGYVKRFTFELPDGRECGAGVRGTQEDLRMLLEDGITPDWATVRYFTPTPDGMPRFPVVIDWGWGERTD